MLVNIPAPWSIWDYVIQSVHQCPTVCVTEKSSKTVRSRWVPLHRAMVASPWWEGRNSQGSQTGISSTNLSLPNKILNLKKCMPFFFEQLGFESVSRYVRWSKLCLGMRLQAKSGPICSVASMQMGEAWLSKARTISTRDPSPEECCQISLRNTWDSFLVLPSALVDGLFQQEHMGIAGWLVGTLAAVQPTTSDPLFACLPLFGLFSYCVLVLELNCTGTKLNFASGFQLVYAHCGFGLPARPGMRISTHVFRAIIILAQETNDAMH